MANYYILKNLDGYGNAAPICVDAAEAGRLFRAWDNGESEFDDIWTEATADDITQYGVYNTPPHWYLIDDRTNCRHGGDIYDDDLGEITEQEAIAEGVSAWQHLTDRERRDGRVYYVCLMQLDEDGCLDWDTQSCITSISNMCFQEEVGDDLS